MISHDYQCIFIHIYKCGGSSIESKLGKYDKPTYFVQDHRSLREYLPPPLALYPYRHNGNMVMLARYLKNRTSITSEQCRSYFKFAFVRNPWGRAYSWYKNVINDPFHQQRLGIDADCSLHDFLLRHAGQRALRPQTYWLQDWHGNIGVDYIGRFESLQCDFERICGRLGIDDPQLPHHVAGDGSHYTDHYDDASRQLVATRYASEIELFSYRFDD